jgi:putative membrane protein
MRRLIPALVAALALFSTSAVAQDKASQKFITEAIEGNHAEVQMGELAQKNGQNQEVKKFGQMLVTDHGAALKKAQEAAKAVGLTTLPAGPNATQKADYDKMAKLTAAAFDKAFAEHMVMDHKKDIAEYEKASKQKDAAGQYAEQTLPTLRKHLDTAQSVQKQVTASR